MWRFRIHLPLHPQLSGALAQPTPRGSTWQPPHVRTQCFRLRHFLTLALIAGLVAGTLEGKDQTLANVVSAGFGGSRVCVGFLLSTFRLFDFPSRLSAELNRTWHQRQPMLLAISPCGEADFSARPSVGLVAIATCDDMDTCIFPPHCNIRANRHHLTYPMAAPAEVWLVGTDYAEDVSYAW